MNRLLNKAVQVAEDKEVSLADFYAQEEDIATQLKKAHAEGKRVEFTDRPGPTADNYAKVIVKPNPTSDLGAKAQVLTANSKTPVTGDPVLDSTRAADVELGTLHSAIDVYRADKLAPIDKKLQETLTRISAIGNDLTKYAGYGSLKRETARLEEEREILAVQAKVLGEQRNATLKALEEDPALKDAHRDLQLLEQRREQLLVEDKERRAAQLRVEERARVRQETLEALPIEARVQAGIEAAEVDANYDAQTIAHFRQAYGRTPGEYVTTELLLPPAVKAAQIEAAKYMADTFGDQLPKPTQALTMPDDKLAFLSRAYQNQQTTQAGKVAMQQWLGMLGTLKSDPVAIQATAERLAEDPTLQAFNEALKPYAADLKVPEAVRIQETMNAWLREQAAKSPEMEVNVHNAAAQFVATQVGGDIQRYTDTLQSVVSEVRDKQKFDAFQVGAAWVAQNGARLGGWNDVVSNLAKELRTPQNMRPAITDSPSVAAAYATEIAKWLWQVTEQKTEGALGKSGYDPTGLWPELVAANSQIGWMERLQSKLFTVPATTPAVAVPQQAPTTPVARPEYMDTYQQTLKGNAAEQPSKAPEGRPEMLAEFERTLKGGPTPSANEGRPAYTNSFQAILQGAQGNGILERFLQEQEYNRQNPWKAGNPDQNKGQAAAAEKDRIMREIAALARDTTLAPEERRRRMEQLAAQIIVEEN